MIVRPAVAAATKNGLPSFSTITVVIEDSIRLPGAMRFGLVPITPLVPVKRRVVLIRSSHC